MLNRKGRSQRISVNLPEEMMLDLKYRSSATGLSISRLIYLQLRSRKPQMIVTNEVLEEVRQMRQLLGELSTTGVISFEALANLKARVEQMSAMVRLDDQMKSFTL